MSKVERLLQLAQELADQSVGFFEIAGPGAGDRRTHTFMRELLRRANDLFEQDLSEQKICGDNNLAVDFFIPEESTIVEVALRSCNPNTEFEHDILRTFMAQEAGHPVTQLVFIAKPGANYRHAQPGSRAIVAWAERNHELRVEIRELTAASFGCKQVCDGELIRSRSRVPGVACSRDEAEAGRAPIER